MEYKNLILLSRDQTLLEAPFRQQEQSWKNVPKLDDLPLEIREWFVSTCHFDVMNGNNRVLVRKYGMRVSFSAVGSQFHEVCALSRRCWMPWRKIPKFRPT